MRATAARNPRDDVGSRLCRASPRAIHGRFRPPPPAAASERHRDGNQEPCRVREITILLKGDAIGRVHTCAWRICRRGSKGRRSVREEQAASVSKGGGSFLSTNSACFPA